MLIWILVLFIARHSRCGITGSPAIFFSKTKYLALNIMNLNIILLAINFGKQIFMLICFLDQTTQGSWLKLTIIGATVDIEDMQAA